jgi:hypothetical protein
MTPDQLEAIARDIRAAFPTHAELLEQHAKKLRNRKRPGRKPQPPGEQEVFRRAAAVRDVFAEIDGGKSPEEAVAVVASKCANVTEGQLVEIASGCSTPVNRVLRQWNFTRPVTLRKLLKGTPRGAAYLAKRCFKVNRNNEITVPNN